MNVIFVTKYYFIASLNTHFLLFILKFGAKDVQKKVIFTKRVIKMKRRVIMDKLEINLLKKNVLKIKLSIDKKAF